MAGLIYLASPYSAPAPEVRIERYNAALAFTTKKLAEGYALFSPIVYGEYMAADLGTTFEAWANLNDRVIAACDSFWVLTLPGWRASRGIAHEIKVWENIQPFRQIRYFNQAGTELFDEDYRHNHAG